MVVAYLILRFMQRILTHASSVSVISKKFDAVLGELSFFRDQEDHMNVVRVS